MNGNNQPYNVVRIGQLADGTPNPIKVNVGNSFEQASDLARMDRLQMRELGTQRPVTYRIINAVTGVMVSEVTLS